MPKPRKLPRNWPSNRHWLRKRLRELLLPKLPRKRLRNKPRLRGKGRKQRKKWPRKPKRRLLRWLRKRL